MNICSELARMMYSVNLSSFSFRIKYIISEKESKNMYVSEPITYYAIKKSIAKKIDI